MLHKDTRLKLSTYLSYPSSWFRQCESCRCWRDEVQCVRSDDDAAVIKWTGNRDCLAAGTEPIAMWVSREGSLMKVVCQSATPKV